MRVGLLALLVLFAPVAGADWIDFGETPTAMRYIDPATIRGDGNLRRVWTLQELKARDSLGALSQRACASTTARKKSTEHFYLAAIQDRCRRVPKSLQTIRPALGITLPLERRRKAISVSSAPNNSCRLWTQAKVTSDHDREALRHEAPSPMCMTSANKWAAPFIAANLPRLAQ